MRIEQGEKLSRVPLHLIGTLNFDINLGKATVGEILMLIWRSYSRAEF
jgi:hypothetical protein